MLIFYVTKVLRYVFKYLQSFIDGGGLFFQDEIRVDL